MTNSKRKECCHECLDWLENGVPRQCTDPLCKCHTNENPPPKKCEVHTYDGKAIYIHPTPSNPPPKCCDGCKCKGGKDCMTCVLRNHIQPPPTSFIEEIVYEGGFPAENWQHQYMPKVYDKINEIIRRLNSL